MSYFDGAPVYVPAELWAVLSTDVSAHVTAGVRVSCVMGPLSEAIIRAWNADHGPETVRVTSRFPTYRTHHVSVDLGIEVDDDGIWVVVI